MSDDNQNLHSPSAPTSHDPHANVSFFDTFEMPTTDIVTTSVEDALNAMTISDTPVEAETAAPVEAVEPIDEEAATYE